MELGFAINPTVEFLTLAITIISGYFAFRQRSNVYTEAKDLLVSSHVLFSLFILLEILKTFIPKSLVIDTYATLGTTLILGIVEILTLISWQVYLQGSTHGFSNLIRSIFKSNKKNALIFGVGSLYIAFVDAYLLIFHPYEIMTVPSFGGVSVVTNEFSQTFLILLLAVLILFMAYPTTLFLLARRKTKQSIVRRALVLLPLAWICIGLDLLVFNGYSISMGFDALALGYLFASVGIGATAFILRRASLLAAFFKPSIQMTLAPSYPFSKSVGLKSPIPSGSYLLEVEPSLNYERLMKDLAVELVSNKFLVFVFTPAASRTYGVLSPIKGVRFYIMTSTASYPGRTEDSNQMVVPEDDPTILLDTLRKTILSVTQSSGIAVVFDNLSDMIMTAGAERCYKFIKRANEILAEREIVVSIFLLTKGAHDEKTTNLIQNLFRNHIVFDSEGTKLKRASEPALDLEMLELLDRTS